MKKTTKKPVKAKASTKKPLVKRTPKPRKTPPARVPAVPDKRPAQSKFTTTQKLARFLHYYMITGEVYRSCKKAGCDPKTYYNHMKTDGAFAKAFDEAEMIVVRVAEDELYKRAVTGVKEKIYHNGKVVGFQLKKSDALLLAFLRAKKKDVYGITHTHRGDPDAPISFEDLGRDAAMAEIAAIFAGAGLKAPIGPCESVGAVKSAVDSATRPANNSPAK